MRYNKLQVRMLLGVGALLLALAVHAGILDRIIKSLKKGDFDKAQDLIEKSLEKETINPGAKYLKSKLFLTEEFNSFNIDSAAFYIRMAISDYDSVSEETQEDLKKSGIRSEDFSIQYKSVASAAFQRSSREMTIEAFQQYLQEYEGTEDYERAKFARDSLAFEKVKQAGDWKSYENYFQQFADSPFAQEAKSRFQSLVFKDYTQDDRLESYEQFLRTFPETPFKSIAEGIIFEKRVRRNTPKHYQDFIVDYPKSRYAKKAADILYYMTREGNPDNIEEVMEKHPLMDSLRSIHRFYQNRLIPVLENRQYGFMNCEGQVFIEANFFGIDKRYLCGNISDEWLEIVGIEGIKQVVNRSGLELILDYDRLKKLSESVYLVTDRINTRMYHASGHLISTTTVEDARMLKNHFIAFRKDYLWGVMNMAGSVIIEPLFAEIEDLDPFILFKNSSNRYAVSNYQRMQDGFVGTFDFDDFELIQDSLLQGFSGDMECILTLDLDYLLPLDSHRVLKNGTFWYVKYQDGYRVLAPNSGLGEQVFSSLLVNEEWFAFEKDEGWMLISRTPGGVSGYSNLDSVRLLNEYFVFIEAGDTSHVLFQNGIRLPIESNDRVEVLKSKSMEGSVFLKLTHSNKQIIYDRGGTGIISQKFQELELLSDSVFRFKKSNKVGLLNAKGEIIVKPDYDLIDEKDGLFLLLTGQKIGCYDAAVQVLLPPQYDARIEQFGDYYRVNKKGRIYLVDRYNESLNDNGFDQVMTWTDSSFWARDKNEWKLMTFEGQSLIENMQSVKFWMLVEDEQLIVAKNADGYGVIGNQSGWILPAQYNDITNVGSESQPVFFAEQHLKMASFYVVTYVNLDGETIRSQAFRPEEYSLIYCDL